MKRKMIEANDMRSFFGNKKRRQEDYASHTVEKIREKIDFNLLEKVGKERVDITLKSLIMKWTGGNCSIEDCEGRRLVNRFVREKLNNLITLAILADDKSTFFEIFNSSERNALPSSLPELVSFACICGAISIVSELLCNEEIMSKCSKDLIAYAVSSGNRELALEVSAFFRAKGEEDPGLIYFYSFGKILLAGEIKDFFKCSNKSFTPH